ncbi:MAG: DNA-protecting protein DprA [Campylobacter sp.]|nr:DNA-protecting protein DprA [Campylobacter sp.]
MKKIEFLQKSELPKELNRLKKGVNGLYFIGDKNLLKQPKISVVGSRKASVYTKEWVYSLCKALANAKICVVSGGALGVDIAAHQASMPRTISVFANGLDTIYPIANKKSILEIYENALAVSEYNIGEAPLPYRFLERNRIVVGLGQALVVAQADLQSGSMQSALMARKMGIPVYVLPQRIHESKGTNKLLSEGKANIINDIGEFVAKFSNFTPSLDFGGDEILDFCQNGVDLDLALQKFGDKIYEYEILGLVKISNLIVKSL